MPWTHLLILRIRVSDFKETSEIIAQACEINTQLHTHDTLQQQPLSALIHQGYYWSSIIMMHCITDQNWRNKSLWFVQVTELKSTLLAVLGLRRAQWRTEINFVSGPHSEIDLDSQDRVYIILSIIFNREGRRSCLWNPWQKKGQSRFPLVWSGYCGRIRSWEWREPPIELDSIELITGKLGRFTSLVIWWYQSVLS